MQIVNGSLIIGFNDKVWRETSYIMAMHLSFSLSKVPYQLTAYFFQIKLAYQTIVCRQHKHTRKNHTKENFGHMNVTNICINIINRLYSCTFLGRGWSGWEVLHTSQKINFQYLAKKKHINVHMLEGPPQVLSRLLRLCDLKQACYFSFQKYTIIKGIPLYLCFFLY